MPIKPLAIKVTAGIIGAGGAIAIAHQGYQALKKEPEKTIELSNSQKLISEKYELLSTTPNNDGQWNTILESYREAFRKDSNLGFDDFDGVEPVGTEGPKAAKTLKEKCTKALESKDEKLLDKVRKWCVTPVSVLNLLKARGYEPLKADGDVNDGKKEWEAKITAFWKAKKKDPNIAAIITKPEKETIEGAVITEIKQKCKDISTIMSHKEGFKSSLENFKLWCANKK